MTDSIIPIIMLAIFLAGTLWLGMKYKKGSIASQNIPIGDKTFSTAALTATIITTTYGSGGLTRAVGTIYVKGLWYIAATVGSVIVYNLACIAIASRVGTFIESHIPPKNHISMADTMGKVYGRIPRIMTALATVGLVIVNTSSQILVTSRILKTCISDTNPTILIVTSASIVVLYSIFGGIRSVTITDIFQCATFIIMNPYITYKYSFIRV